MSALTSTVPNGQLVAVSNTLTLAILVFNRGLLDDILSNPGKIVSDILSSPATTTQNNEQPANTPAAAQTQTAAAAVPAATTPAAEAPVATTQAPVAKQPAATPAASPKQEQPQEIHTSLPPALVLPSTQQPAPSTSAAPLTTAAKSASRDEVLTTSPPVAAETVPPKAENAASSQVPLQPAVNSKTGAASIEGAVTTKTEATSPTQPSQTLTPGGTSNSTNQGPLVATGVVLGIVVFLGLSLLLFWCLRRKKKADRHDHTAVPSTSPVNEHGDVWIPSAAADPTAVSDPDLPMADSLVSQWSVHAERLD
ncbi:uncharacterized protein GLRG_09740 [Colletotrichum graminicola M1.001]|uniref:Uncharacterized protein n=1 Tax=Colletotrichum graminicola (strain M1.001 / M2 / FGSC 10212) TaxID=645133 RepID=E3QUQ8_COLGM|nr:uncharacterized protein GLRG_09740 [Colletotrichum graminicola M1.001]EFQ34596.1 hypothetical protein GLRG_09740 [Colletotrichum graminicola M1.001]